LFEDATGVKTDLNTELVTREKLAAFFRELLQNLESEKQTFEKMTPRKLRSFLQDWAKSYFG
jgi:cell pole-organizing protein PopZ